MTQELIEIHCSYLKVAGLNEEARKLKMDGVLYHNINKTSYNDAVKVFQTLKTEEFVKQIRATLDRIS